MHAWALQKCKGEQSHNNQPKEVEMMVDYLPNCFTDKTPNCTQTEQTVE